MGAPDKIIFEAARQVLLLELDVESVRLYLAFCESISSRVLVS